MDRIGEPRIGAGPVDLAVVADTHLGAGIARLPAPLLDALAAADVIVHAGDVVSVRALDELARLGPLYAVRGNNDRDLAALLPEELEVELAGVRMAVVHDSGPSAGRAGRMARRFPRAGLVVFGHSHVPVDVEGANGQLLFNPGSPTQRRSQPFPTFGRVRLEAGRVCERRIVTLPPPT